MIEIRITIEQQKDGRMGMTIGTPESMATPAEMSCFGAIEYAIRTMIAIQGGGTPIEIEVPKEMRGNPAKN